MADVQVRFMDACIRVELYGEVLHEARWPDEACQVADWARMLLKRGATLTEIRAALGGAPMEGAGDGVLLAEAESCHGVLRGSIEELERVVSSGCLDEDLGALLEAERLGARRPEVERVILERRRQLGDRAA